MPVARRRLLAEQPFAASPSLHLPRSRRSPLLSVVRRLLIALGVLLLVTLLVYLDRDGYTDNTGRPMGWLDALYYATVTLSTTGYGDVVPASEQARLVNVLAVTPLRILFLIILVGTTVEVLAERTRDQVKQSRWRSSLRSHTVVVGYGTKGRSAVAVLVEDGADPAQFIAVDTVQAHIDEATADGLAAILGDGTRSQVLAQAQVATARRIIIAVPRDDTAVLTTLTARAANRTARLVVAVREAENLPLLQQSGADQVIVSSEAAGRLLGVGVASPATGEVLADLLQPGKGLELATRRVTDAEIGVGVNDVPERVVSVVRAGETLPFSSPACAILKKGDLLVHVQEAHG